MMALRLTALLVFLISATDFIDASRSDYTLIRSLGAYYKFHSENATLAVALSTCHSEGARLLHPGTKNEFQVVKREMAISDNVHYLLLCLPASERPIDWPTLPGLTLGIDPLDRPMYVRGPEGVECLCSFMDLGNNRGRHVPILTSVPFEICITSCQHAAPFICKHKEKVTAKKTTVTPAKSKLKQ